MSEDQTFNTLKRTPFKEMMGILENSGSRPAPPIFNIGDNMLSTSSSQYRILMKLHSYKTLLEDNGWEFEDFMKEIEKDTLLKNIDAFNSSIQFPTDLISHAKKFFPDIKFTPARIEFE